MSKSPRQVRRTNKRPSGAALSEPTSYRLGYCWLRSDNRIYCALPSRSTTARVTLDVLRVELVEVEEADEAVARAGLGASVARVLQHAAVLRGGLRGEAKGGGEEEEHRVARYCVARNLVSIPCNPLLTDCNPLVSLLSLERSSYSGNAIPGNVLSKDRRRLASCPSPSPDQMSRKGSAVVARVNTTCPAQINYRLRIQAPAVC